jgi:hypothetical protein
MNKRNFIFQYISVRKEGTKKINFAKNLNTKDLQRKWEYFLQAKEIIWI